MIFFFTVLGGHFKLKCATNPKPNIGKFRKISDFDSNHARFLPDYYYFWFWGGG